MRSIRKHRILLIANETVEGAAAQVSARARAVDAHRVEVLVIAPALNSRLRHWLSDEDEARRSAAERLRSSLHRLEAEGIDANGMVGDADPLQAIEDGLRRFAADELVIATHPEGRSHWLERDLVGRARARVQLPVSHVIVDEARQPAAA